MPDETVEAATKTCRKVNRLVGAHVLAEFLAANWWGDHERWARQLESRAKSFNEFIRDHRSQDDIRLEVVREHKDFCSACNREYEPDEYPDGEGCANCGALLEKPHVP